MQTLTAPPTSPRRGSSPHYDTGSSLGRLLAQDSPDQMTSRHDPETLIARAVPVDPYTAWLSQREAERRASPVAAATRPAGCFRRNQSTKAPWEPILVTLSPDTR